MADKMVAHLVNLLQNDPEQIAEILMALLVWNIVNSVLAMLLKLDIGGIEKVLKKRGIWL